jgi:hypothetical protein
MPKYRVIAEFVDLEAKRRCFPEETVEAPPERAKVLIDKGVIYPVPLEEAQKEADVQPPEEAGKEDSESAAEKPGKQKAKAK